MLQEQTNSNTATFVCALTQPPTCTHTHPPMQTCMLAHVRTHKRACTHAPTHIHTHTTKYDSPSEYPEFCYTFSATAVDYHRQVSMVIISAKNYKQKTLRYKHLYICTTMHEDIVGLLLHNNSHYSLSILHECFKQAKSLTF